MEQAILLYADGRILDSYEWQNGVCWFLYENLDKCDETISNYRKGKLMLNAQSFINSFRTIKSILRSN